MYHVTLPVPRQERCDGSGHLIRLLGEQGVGRAVDPHGCDPVAEPVGQFPPVACGFKGSSVPNTSSMGARPHAR